MVFKTRFYGETIMRKPFLNVEFFRARRRRVAQLIPNCALILPAWPEYYRNADNHHAYRPESGLYYLTGFDEPESCLIMRPGKSPESVLFVRRKNPELETWDGFRYGLEAAKEVFGMDHVYAIDEFSKVAPELLRDCERVYYSLFRNHEFDPVFGKVMIDIHGYRPRFGLGLPPIEDANSLLGELRIRKTEEEADLLRRAGSITAEAHVDMMKATKPGITERALHGLFIKSVMEKGAFGEAYGGIVATGNNATTLHYRFNESTLEAGQLILVDCGAEYQFYSGDITRTFPVNGRFSIPQKRIYEKVLQVQKEVIEMVKPGVPHMNLQKHTVERLTQVLIEERLLTGSVEDGVRNGSYRKYYPHGVSHLLGLDTHDAGAIQVQGQSRAMEAGWCLTVEPGLYFPATDPQVPNELKGIGIRIEDDVLVTPDGAEVMTGGVPKEVEEIEALVGTDF
jgi:Xaa-Pro aminopeptidase